MEVIDQHNRRGSYMISSVLLICFLLQSGPFAPALSSSVTLGFRVRNASTESLTVSPSFSASEPVNQDGPIDLYLSRPLHDPESRAAVLIGTTDVSSLFARQNYDCDTTPNSGL